ncbi:MAG: hypothetical protein RMJ44_12430 [Cytophagales bacterium]|nr:hypothetical protein [Bacteroidia bacterium]MDW8211881.1 hypothetical protein [Cytophagales bacterium]
MTTIQPINSVIFSINGVPKQRGKYEIVRVGELVGIRMVGRDGWVKGCELQPVSKYNGGAYPNANAFISFLQDVIFK